MLYGRIIFFTNNIIWLQRDKEPPVKEKKMINSPKMMLTPYTLILG